MNPPHKLLIQMSGAPGSGKSTLAKLLAKSIDGIVLDHDVLKSFFIETGNDFQQSARLSYRFQWILAEDMIKQERTVIIDSTCNYQETLDQGMALAQKYGLIYKYVECRVSDIDLLDQRLQNRQPLRSQRPGVNHSPLDADSNSGDPRELFKRWIENPCRPASDVIVVDSSCSREYCLEMY